MADVTIFENANFQGTSRTFGAGSFRFFDFSDMNDMTSSIRVAKGSLRLFMNMPIAREGMAYRRTSWRIARISPNMV